MASPNPLPVSNPGALRPANSEFRATAAGLPALGFDGAACVPYTVAETIAAEDRVHVDLSKVVSPTSFATKLRRTFWHCFQLPFWNHTPRVLSPLRIFLLRAFGAKIGKGCHIDYGVKVWIPWNLTMGDYSCIGFNTEVYNFAPVTLGDHTILSQRCYVCTASHDYTHPHHPLTTDPIIIESEAWVAAGVYLAPGVTVGEGSVVGACSVVTHSLPAWKVCAGNPCRALKDRILHPAEELHS